MWTELPIRTRYGAIVEIGEAPTFEVAASLFAERQPHILGVLANADGVPWPQISAMIESAVNGGVLFLCTWGQDCERVHDLADDVFIALGLTEPDLPLIPTTWHSKNTVSEAIEFVLLFAKPALEGPVPELRRRILVIGEAVSRDEIHRAIHEFSGHIE